MRPIRDGAIGFVAGIAAWLVQLYAGADAKAAAWRALVIGISMAVAAELVARWWASRSGSGKPQLEIDDELNSEAIDAANARFLLRIWNQGGGIAMPEVRITNCMVGDAKKLPPFSNRLPFLLPWAGVGAAPRLTRQHRTGEAVVVGTLAYASR